MCSYACVRFIKSKLFETVKSESIAHFEVENYENLDLNILYNVKSCDGSYHKAQVLLLGGNVIYKIKWYREIISCLYPR